MIDRSVCYLKKKPPCFCILLIYLNVWLAFGTKSYYYILCCALRHNGCSAQKVDVSEDGESDDSVLVKQLLWAIYKKGKRRQLLANSITAVQPSRPKVTAGCESSLQLSRFEAPRRNHSFGGKKEIREIPLREWKEETIIKASVAI